MWHTSRSPRFKQQSLIAVKKNKFYSMNFNKYLRFTWHIKIIFKLWWNLIPYFSHSCGSLSEMLTSPSFLLATRSKSSKVEFWEPFQKSCVFLFTLIFFPVFSCFQKIPPRGPFAKSFVFSGTENRCHVNGPQKHNKNFTKKDCHVNRDLLF